MLLDQFLVERVLELLQGGVDMSWNGNGLTLVLCSVGLDEVFEVVVVEVICERPSQSLRNRSRSCPSTIESTYVVPIGGPKAP